MEGLYKRERKRDSSLYCFSLAAVVFICLPTRFLCFKNTPTLISWGNGYLKCTRRNLCAHVVRRNSSPPLHFYMFNTTTTTMRQKCLQDKRAPSPLPLAYCFSLLSLTLVKFSRYCTLANEGNVNPYRGKTNFPLGFEERLKTDISFIIP